MAVSKLTARFVAGVKPGEKPAKYFDGGGLHLWVSPAGAKRWRWAYRDSRGKPQVKTLGAYPEMSLAQARDRHRIERSQPQAHANVTFAQCAEQYWAGRDAASKTRETALRAMQSNLAGIWAMPISRVTRADLMAQLEPMNDRGVYDFVRKVRRWAGQVFDWAEQRELVATNPVHSIKPKAAFGDRKVKHFPWIRPADVGRLLHRMSFEGRGEVGTDTLAAHACWWLAMTWVRTNEMTNMRWQDVHGDQWVIPHAMVKQTAADTEADHIVPLSRQALARLQQLREIRLSDTYVFPNSRRPYNRPMSNGAVLALLSRCGYAGKMTGHGWRSTASTWAYESGRYRELVIEAQLDHEDSNKVRVAYNHAEFIGERRQMMQDYSDWLEGQLAAQTNKVLTFKR